MAEKWNGTASSSRRWKSETDDTEYTTMADDYMALPETLRMVSSDGDVDVLREVVRVLAQALMKAEVPSVTGVPMVSATRSAG